MCPVRAPQAAATAPKWRGSRRGRQVERVVDSRCKPPQHAGEHRFQRRRRDTADIGIIVAAATPLHQRCRDVVAVATPAAAVAERRRHGLAIDIEDAPGQRSARHTISPYRPVLPVGLEPTTTLTPSTCSRSSTPSAGSPPDATPPELASESQRPEDRGPHRRLTKRDPSFVSLASGLDECEPRAAVDHRKLPDLP